MKNFTIKLVLYCTGITFASFLLVYILFNVLAHNYIRSEAERELAGGMRDVATLTYALPSIAHTHHFYTGNNLDASASIFVRDYSTDVGIALRIDEIGARWQFLPSNITAHSMQDSLQELIILDASTILEGSSGIGYQGLPPGLALWGTTSPQADQDLYNRVYSTSYLPLSRYSIRPIRQASMMNIDTIILSHNNDIISPILEHTAPSIAAEVSFIAAYYQANNERFRNAEMVMVSDNTSTFYVSATSQTLPASANNISILMYTDITHAMAFTNTMNRFLRALLLVSGIFAIGFSAIMSTKFRRAVKRLCGYAEEIGRGNFATTAGTFKDTEFIQLAKSMDNMSAKLRAYEESQKQFFQNVSHELRTPLMSIQGYAEGIAEDIFEHKEAAGIIISEGQKMTDLVNQLLHVSRMDQQDMSNIAPLNLATILSECIDCVHPIAQKANKQIYVNMDILPTTTIIANEEKLTCAITNILTNAIRHAKSKVEIKCTVDFHGNSFKRTKILPNSETFSCASLGFRGSLTSQSIKTNPGKKLATIAIQDDGDGIAEKDFPYIFDRLYKGENGNHGLGLAISHDIIKNMNGEIIVQNLPTEADTTDEDPTHVPGESGAVFTVVLHAGDIT